MPLSSGMSIHNDTKHKGSAKRDTASGVAALNVVGNLLAPGARLILTRDGADNISIEERTSGEFPMYFHRVGADDFEVYVHIGGGFYEVQHEGMKDVANGIAGLDANGKVPVDLLIGIEKVYKLSGDILHSYDADTFTTSVAYVEKKNIAISVLSTFESTLRIGFKLWSVDAARTATAKIYKNGAPVGAERNVIGTTPEYFYEDLAFSQGDDIELYVHTDNEFIQAHVADFRVFGLKSDLTLAEAIVNSTVGLVDPFVGSNSPF